MKDVDEYVQLNYSNYCDLLLLGSTFVNEKLSLCYSCDFDFSNEY